MKGELYKFFRLLRKRYKNERYIGIYTMRQANKEMMLLCGEPICDDEFLDTEFYVCNKFRGANGKPWSTKDYIEGAYFVEVDKESGELIAWWSCYPDPPHIGQEDILKCFDKFKDEITQSP